MPFPGRKSGQEALTVVGILAGRGPDSQHAFSALSEVGDPKHRRRTGPRFETACPAALLLGRCA